MIHCSLCGFEFEKSDTPCQHGCPLGRFCNLICCPNCRYEFPEKSQSIRLLQRLFHRPKAPRRDVMPLPELSEGEHGELVCLNCEHASRRNSLAVFGLVPGTRIQLQQKRPAVVVRVGETELALDVAIARELLVKPVG